MGARWCDAVKMASNCNIRFYLGFWLAAGFVVLLTGLYVLPSRSGYKTEVYILFLLPSLILLVMNIQTLGRHYFKGDVLLFLCFISYLAFSSLWGDSSELQSNLKRVLIISIAGYGLFNLMLAYERLFYISSYISIFIVSVVGVFWLVDFYWLMGNKFGVRLFFGGMDYYGLYEHKHYGGFFNPLRFSHTITFFLTLLVGLFYLGVINNRYLKFGLISSGLVLIVLLLAAQTRMAWVLVMSIFFVMATLKWRYMGNIIAIIVLVVIGLLFTQLDHPVVERGLSHRPEIWSAVLDQMSGAWLYGHGMGAYFEVEVIGVIEHFYDPHNIYLSILYYSGFFGLALLFLALIRLILGLYHKNKMSPWVVLWLVYVGLAGMTDGGGLLSRPNENWFNLLIPMLFLLVNSRTKEVKARSLD